MASFKIDGRTVSEDAFKRYWTERFAADPEMQRLLEQAQNPTALRASQTQALADAKTSLIADRAAGKKVGFSEAIRRVSPAQSMGERGKERLAKDRAKALGYVAPDHDWSVDFDEQGFRPERANYWTRNKDWLGPVIVAGAGAGLGGLSAAGAFGGSGAAATPTLAPGIVAPAGSVPAGLGGAGVSLGAAPTAAAAAAAPAAGASVGTGVGFGAGGTPIAGAAPTTMASGAGSTAAGSAGLTAPAAGGFSWGKALAGLGVDAFKTFMSNRTAGKTNDAIQKGNQQAIDLYKDALSPYMTLGKNAATAQNYLMGFPAGPAAAEAPQGAGLPAVSGRTMPAGATPTGTAVPRLSTPPLADSRAGLSAFGRSPQAEAQQQTASSFQPVRMVLNGEEDWVHPSQVQAAQQQGAKLVGV